MHCCCIDELYMVSLDIEGASPVFAVGECGRITEDKIEFIISIPKPIYYI